MITMNTNEREKLILGLARAVTGLAKLDGEQRRAIAAVADALPDSCTLSDVISLIKRRAAASLGMMIDGLEPLARSGTTAHLFAQPLGRALVQEVEVEAMLRHLEKRVAFDLECLERGIDPRPRGWA